MNKLLVGLIFLNILPVYSSSIQERALSVDDWCTKDQNINLGIYKLDKGCKVDLSPKEAVEIEGICRGTTNDKNKQKVDYKISFSTKSENTHLNYVAVTKDILWNTDKSLSPEMNFFQPKWSEFKNQRLVVVNKKRSSSVERGYETVVQLKTNEIDMLLIYGEMGISNKKYKANILVKNGDSESELINASCDLMI